jgi:hypothetical protein
MTEWQGKQEYMEKTCNSAVLYTKHKPQQSPAGRPHAPSKSLFSILHEPITFGVAFGIKSSFCDDVLTELVLAVTTCYIYINSCIQQHRYVQQGLVVS